MRRLIGIALILTLTGCAGSTQSLLGAGVTLKAVGQQWEAVNAAFVKACVPSAPKLDVATCTQARDFGVKFKAAYPLAIQLYETAVNARDANMAGDAKHVIRGLSVDLVAFGLQVGMALQEVK